MMSADTRQSSDQQQKRALPKAWWSLVLYPASVAVPLVLFYGLMVVGYPGYAGADTSSFWDVASWWDPVTVTAAVAVLIGGSLGITLIYSNRAAAQGEAHARVPVVIAAILTGCYVVFMLVPSIMFAFGPGEQSDVSPAPIVSVWERIGCEDGEDDAYISTRAESPPMERMAECAPYEGGDMAYFFQFETVADAIAWADGLTSEGDVFIDGRVVLLAKDPITAQKFDELFTAYPSPGS